MSIVTTSLYNYDPTGTKSDNRIVNEPVSVNPPDKIQDFSYFIPRATPFFADSLVIKTGKGPGARTLVENVDYWCVIDFVSASIKTNKRVCSAVAMLDSGYNGTLYITYQTLGGNFALNDVGVMHELIRQRYTARHINYEQIINLPAGFAPDWHEHQLKADIGGFNIVETKLAELIEAIKSKPGSFGQLEAMLSDHIKSKNAHSKEQVGLGNVENFGVANDDDISKGANNKYLVARHLAQSHGNASRALTLIEEHLKDTTAHDKEHVGLGQVENIGVATLQDIASKQRKYVTGDILHEVVRKLVDDFTGLADIKNSIGDLSNRVTALENNKPTPAPVAPAPSNLQTPPPQPSFNALARPSFLVVNPSDTWHANIQATNIELPGFVVNLRWLMNNQPQSILATQPLVGLEYTATSAVPMEYRAELIDGNGKVIGIIHQEELTLIRSGVTKFAINRVVLSRKNVYQHLLTATHVRFSLQAYGYNTTIWSLPVNIKADASTTPAVTVAPATRGKPLAAEISWSTSFNVSGTVNWERTADIPLRLVDKDNAGFAVTETSRLSYHISTDTGFNSVGTFVIALPPNVSSNTHVIQMTGSNGLVLQYNQVINKIIVTLSGRYAGNDNGLHAIDVAGNVLVTATPKA